MTTEPTGHLPECPFGGDTDYSWLDECICDNLRACEARVFVDRTDHWNAALDAARDAVAALPWKVAVSFGPIDCNQSCEHGPCACSGVMRPEAWTTGPAAALAAIDALRATP